METTQPFNPDLFTIPRSAFFIEKLHNCADCPIRKAAIARPHSIFARIHFWHKTWWPGWKAHQARACTFTARSASPA
jgi:hypothetical protein